MGSATVETINAVAGLWKLVLTIAVSVITIIYRKALQKALSGLKNFRFKRGQTEVTVDSSTPSEQPQAAIEGMAEGSQPTEKREQPAEPTPAEPRIFLLEMYEAFWDGRINDAAEAFKSVQQDEGDPDSKIKNEAMYLHLRYQYANDRTAISKLEKLAENENLKGSILYWVAACHEFSLNYPKAIETYRRALSARLDDKDRVELVVALGKSLLKAGKPADALRDLSDGLLRVNSPEGKASLYHGIADVFEADGKTSLQAIALQKVLQFTPEDTGALFSAALTQISAEIPTLSAINYNTLLKFDPKDGPALNNLGVACDRLGLSLKSIAYYKKSAEVNETLAMANLAYRYMNQGFEQETNDLLTKAMHEKVPHKNVGTALASLAELKEKEEKEWNSFTAVAVKQKQFFWDYAEALFEPPKREASFAGQWLAPEGNGFLVIQDDQKLVGSWETEKEGEKFQGTIRHWSAEITFEKKSQRMNLFPPSWGDRQDGYVFLNRDGNTMQIQIVNKKDVRFLSLTREEKSDTQDSKAQSSN